VIGGVLPLALFCGGHNYFVSQFAQRRKPVPLQPYSIHTTYQYAAAAGKRHRLREATVWIDEPAYYDPPGGAARHSTHRHARHASHRRARALHARRVTSGGVGGRAPRVRA
jgi:hypothetical protein